MSLFRPSISVYQAEDPTQKTPKSLKMPTVFLTPLRPDIIRTVHRDINKNRRQAYGVSKYAGHQTAAESWGTGRAVSRIPRVPGGGTHRAGQGAFGNMCRGGHMFNPNRVWRRWHRAPNVTEKRHAMATAIAASAIPALVLARGHRIEETPELPLVVSEGVESFRKTKQAIQFLTKIGLAPELDKVKNSKKLRAGVGKTRGRRFRMRRGILVIYNTDNGVVRAFRNIPGVELCSIERLNLLQFAPGGHFGRMVIWTQPALEKLNLMFGNYNGGGCLLKKGYHLLRSEMTNSDLARIINSEEVQSVLRPKKDGKW